MIFDFLAGVKNIGYYSSSSYFGKVSQLVYEFGEDSAVFFTNLDDVTKVYILGHSLSEVDIPYFEEIVKHIDVNSEWVVTYYGNEELARHKNTIGGLGVENAIFCDLSGI